MHSPVHGLPRKGRRYLKDNKDRRRHKRHTKRLRTVFTYGANTFLGFSSDLSSAGLFIKTQRGLRPGTVLAMEITLPDESVSKLKGRVIRTIKTSESAIKNGMGVEIIEADEGYMRFLDSRFDDVKPVKKDQTAGTTPAYLIMRCKKCGVKNRIDKSKLGLRPRCGSCKAQL